MVRYASRRVRITTDVCFLPAACRSRPWPDRFCSHPNSSTPESSVSVHLRIAAFLMSYGHCKEARPTCCWTCESSRESTCPEMTGFNNVVTAAGQEDEVTHKLPITPSQDIELTATVVQRIAAVTMSTAAEVAWSIARGQG